MVPGVGEDIKVFVHHPVGEVIVRQELINLLCGQFKQLQEMEQTLLCSTSQDIDQVVDKQFEEIDKLVPIFLYDDY